MSLFLALHPGIYHTVQAIIFLSIAYLIIYWIVSLINGFSISSLKRKINSLKRKLANANPEGDEASQVVDSINTNKEKLSETRKQYLIMSIILFFSFTIVMMTDKSGLVVVNEARAGHCKIVEDIIIIKSSTLMVKRRGRDEIVWQPGNIAREICKLARSYWKQVMSHSSHTYSISGKKNMVIVMTRGFLWIWHGLRVVKLS